MVITNANLYSESYNIVESFLQDNLTDPKKRYKTNWVHASMPLLTGRAFSGYPFVILRIDVSEDEKAFDNDQTQKNFRVLISVYSNEVTDIESVCDQIGELFRDETKLTNFSSRGLTGSPISWTLDMNGKKVLFREMVLELRERI